MSNSAAWGAGPGRNRRVDDRDRALGLESIQAVYSANPFSGGADDHVEVGTERPTESSRDSPLNSEEVEVSRTSRSARPGSGRRRGTTGTCANSAWEK